MNLFAFVSVAAGVFAWILVMSFMEGLQSQSREQMLAQNPHLLWEGAVRNDVLSKQSNVEELLGASAQKVEFVFQSEALLERGSAKEGDLVREGIILVGVDDVEKGKAHIGKELSTFSRILPGDEVSLLSVWRLEGVPLKTEVSQVFESRVYEVDKLHVRVNRRDLEAWLGLAGAVSRVGIQLRNPDDADRYKGELSELLGIPLKTWKEVDQSYWYSLRLEKFAMGLSLFFVIVLASLSVNMAVAARVVERSREIALVRSIGLQARNVFLLYLAQGGVLGLLSSVLGALVAFPVGHWISTSFRLPSMYYLTDLPVKWNPLAIVFCCAASTLLCVWASYRPAKRAIKASAAEALKL